MFKKIGVLTTLIFLIQGIGFGQEVTLATKAPRVVQLGERFRISFVANQQGGQFEPGEIGDFQLLSGPNMSSSSSVQIVNGKMSQTVEISYGYIVQAVKEGKFTVTPGKFTYDGKTYTSKPVTIEVIKGRRNAQANSNSNRATTNSNSNSTIGKEDLFIRMAISKKEVVQGEPIVATLKLYTKVNLSQLGNFKAPTFNGFWSELLKQVQNLNFERENVNGEIYRTALIQQHVIIPERSGQLTIDPAELTAVAQLRVQSRSSRSLFDQVFGGVRNIEKVLTSPKININVKPLPGSPPANFNGAVGNIQLSASLDPNQVKANNPINLTVTYSGSGNLKLLEAPNLKFPPDFEVYDPKISNQYSANSKGFSGKKSFEYLVIPRHEGTYEIPVIECSVFDLASKSYKTLKAGPFPITVEKGDGNTSIVSIDPRQVKEDVQAINADIRYIKTNSFELRAIDKPFFGSWSFYLSYLGSIGLFSLAFLLLRQQRQRNEDVIYVKQKKAAKVANARLKVAKAHLQKGEANEFYKALLTAQWGYISDKLNVQQANLSKDLVIERLKEKLVPDTIINSFIGLMNQCEFAQFAPPSNQEGLNKTLEEANEVFNQLEAAFAKK